MIDGTLDPRRFRLVVLQERRRLRGEDRGFSCACEATFGDESDEQLEFPFLQEEP